MRGAYKQGNWGASSAVVVLADDTRRTLLMIVVPNHLPGRAAFSVTEVCAQTGLGRDTVYNAIRSGKLVARKLGRRTLITEKDLHRFLANLPRAGAGQAA